MDCRFAIFAALASTTMACTLERPRDTSVASGIHPEGISDPDHPAFHGKLLKDGGWDFETCQECHGDDYSGGTSGSSCLTCHPTGPTDCVTCHGEGPTTGRHPQHFLGLNLDKIYDCDTCHPKPTDYRDPGHLYLADGSPAPEGARMRFSELAGGDNARYMRGQKTCAVYCHGGAFDDSSAAMSTPKWDDDLSEPACDSCHGAPPSSHAEPDCRKCHQQVTPVAGGFIKSLHLDGVVQVGQGTEDCSDCHGDLMNPAPPTDLLGRSETRVVTIGAHQSHLLARRRISNPVACTDCHLVPTALTDAGHIDTAAPAEVFPAEISGESLAFVDSATPTWTRTSTTCSTVYCHGGGAGLSNDTSAGLNRTPLWNRPGRDEAVCGSCHGIPPSMPPHDPAMTSFDCHTCHASSVDENGGIIFTGPSGSETTVHLNGVVDR